MKKLHLLSLLLLSIQLNAQTFTKHDIVLGKSSANPENLYTTDSKIYFYCNDKDSSYHLHSIDSIGILKKESDSTRRLKSNSSLASNSYFRNIIKIADTIYFTAYDTAKNGAPFVDYEMYDKLFALYPDGSSEKIVEQATGLDVSVPAFFTELNGKLYFMGKQYYHKNDLYEYDPAIKQLKKLTTYLWQQGLEIHHNMDVVAFNNRIYFSGRDSSTHIEVFVYDPIKDTIELLADINPGFSSSIPQNWVIYNERLYFTAYDGSNTHLYKIDGATNQINIVDTLKDWSNITSSHKARRPLVFKGAIYFRYRNSKTGECAIAKFDSTTHKTTSIPVKKYNGHIGALAVYNDSIYFVGSSDYQHTYQDTAKILVYDGDTSMRVLTDTLSFIRDLTVFKGNLYFAAKSNNEYGWELYHYNDSLVTTNPTIINNPLNTISNITAFPNPANNVVHINFLLDKNETVNVRLIDMNGKLVYETSSTVHPGNNNTVDIPVNNLPSGNYIYSLNDSRGNSLATGKFTKQ